MKANEYVVCCGKCKKEFPILISLPLIEISRIYGSINKFFVCPFCKSEPDKVFLEGKKIFLHFEAPRFLIEKEIRKAVKRTIRHSPFKWRRIKPIVDKVMQTAIQDWLAKREKLNFREWEDYALNHPSLKYFDESLVSALLDIFGSEKNLNYYYFWIINE